MDKYSKKIITGLKKIIYIKVNGCLLYKNLN